MSEKRGQTEKIKFDFNTAGVLEIQSADGTWYRVTAKTFRSYDGPRRITEPEFTEKSNPSVPMRTYVYEGPVFYFESNKQAVKQTNFTTRYL
jgi:hypothetical protein